MAEHDGYVQIQKDTTYFIGSDKTIRVMHTRGEKEFFINQGEDTIELNPEQTDALIRVLKEIRSE